MRVDADFDTVDKPMPSGLYAGEIISAEMRNTKTDGSSMIAWRFAVIEPGEFHGRRLTYFTNSNDRKVMEDGSPDLDAQKRSLYYLRQFLRTIKAEFDPKGFDTDAAMHCKATLKVSTTEVDGQPRTNIEQVLPYNE